MGVKYIHGGKIHTMCQAGIVDAMLIVDDRILAVGRGDEINPGSRSKVEMIDLRGKTVFPGFHDSHIHFLMYAVSRKRIDLINVPTVDEGLAFVAKAVEKAEPGEWIVGRGWDKGLWVDFPTRQQLDSVAPNNPVWLSSKCGHSTWVNSQVLKMAGIDGKTTSPEGGFIYKDERGEPTGILQDMAIWLAQGLVPQPTPDFVYKAAVDCIPHLWGMGITCIHAPDEMELFDMGKRLRLENDLPLRIALMPSVDILPHLKSFGLKQGYGDDWVWTAQVKMFKDGSLGASTALLSEPYEHRPDTSGLEIIPQKEMIQTVSKCVDAGYGVAVHAVGDEAVSRTLDAVASSWEQSNKLDIRHRIEHAQYIQKQDILRFGKLNVTASVQPSHIVADSHMSDRELGARSNMAFPLVRLLGAGTNLAFGSDAPVDTPDPIYGTYCAVNRHSLGESEGDAWYPEERVSILDAIKAYTKGAAFTVKKESDLGELSKGRLADFVVLSDDLLSMHPEDLCSVKVEAVCIGGRFVMEPRW